ncbi:hypothetical protein BJ166DRAFT_188663 [Pestalotiopsis sp. NC0098]|nr:hypothetical protein BJ166DRAFT_188663 [Pestalotiopsis sp. NC0098]
MSSRSSFVPRLSLGGHGGSKLATQYQQRGRSNDYDLSELSPRPSSPLLSPDHVRDFGLEDPYANGEHASSNRSSQGKGKAKAKAVAYADQGEQFPPVSVVDRMRTYREGQAATRDRERQTVDNFRGSSNGPMWQPPRSVRYRDDSRMHQSQRASPQSKYDQTKNLGASFIGFLNPSPATSDLSTTGDVDNTFRTIQRREKQIQKELQNLLDAQAAALDQGGAAAGGGVQDGDNMPKGASRSSSSPYRSRSVSSYDGSPAPAVMPVRQPKLKPLTIRQVRASIARFMAMLSDLKEEEDAYIASAISSRKVALARANKLSNQHKAISADLHALESDDPLRKELDGMNQEYGQVCGDIDEFEGKLRALKHRKRVLEARMEEVRSERESGLSGYRGALREAERDIGQMMKAPSVKVLSLEEDSESTAPGSPDSTSQEKTLERALNGHEFLRMRPERRTLAMAKEWWDGEIALLARRKLAVDKERDALSQGSEVWADTMQLIVDYERRLAAALSESVQVRPGAGKDLEEGLFRGQYEDLRQTTKELEKNLELVEQKGYNLLVAAIGAELEGFIESENILAGLMRAKGYDLPQEAGLVDVDRNSEHGGDDTRDSTDASGKSIGYRLNEDELSGSVVRRWGGQSETRTPPNREQEVDVGQPAHDTRHLSEDGQDHLDESDNEVPADLLVSTAHVDETEDEHANEVPTEFLSMRIPSMEAKLERGEEEDDNSVPRELLGEVVNNSKDDGID